MAEICWVVRSKMLQVLSTYPLVNIQQAIEHGRL